MLTRFSTLLALNIALLFTTAKAAAQLQGSAPVNITAAPAVTRPDVQVSHVFIVMEENHSYSDVIGNPAMPYLNSLASTYSIAQGYYANTHPSIGNYFMLTTGQVITNDDGYTQTVTVDNVVRELIAAGKTWKEYSEALPHQGYDGGDTGEYAERHNPLSYMSDVRNNPTQQQNLVPFTQLATDIANHALPNYGFIVPDLLTDAHDGTLAHADTWLQNKIAPLLASPDFNTSGGGLLIITFDESEDSDTEFGGGQVAWIAVGPNVNPGYPPSGSFIPVTVYQHQSTCRFMLKLAGVSVFPGAAATAPDMNEFLLGN
ncbi:MAG: alkaline phosphatase family protein [Candidatus Korobacteraceae bacterium]